MSKSLFSVALSTKHSDATDRLEPEASWQNSVRKTVSTNRPLSLVALRKKPDDPTHGEEDNKPPQTKIMVQIWDALAFAIKRDMRALHIKRDSYLNALLEAEIGRLESEVRFVTPPAARHTIGVRLRSLQKRERITLSLDRDLAERIDNVLEQRNISRDSFVNRVLFFLVAKPKHLDMLGLSREELSGKMQACDPAWSFLKDPFRAIRHANGGRLYSIVFPDTPLDRNWPNLFGLNCAVSEEEWERVQTPAELSLLDEFSLKEAAIWPEEGQSDRKDGLAPASWRKRRSKAPWHRFRINTPST